MSTSGAPSAADLAGLAALLRRSGTTVECEVTGESMGRAVPAGATVRIRCDGATGAPNGAIIALLIGGALSVHRLVHRGRSRRARGWIVSEGDANLTCDAPVREGDVVGVVEAVRLAGGEWEPVLAAPSSAQPRLITVAVRHVISLGLELHPRLAQALKGSVVLAMTPFVRLRPYPAERGRHASVAHRPRS
jgi:hypothetical protein